MKRIVAGFAVVLLVFAVTGEGHAGEGPYVEAGAKLWYNQWRSSGPTGTFRSGNNLLIGPAITARFGSNVFLDGSFLFSTSDYRFPNQLRFDRRDFEAAVGYMITNMFGLLLGYKSVLLNETRPGVHFKQSFYGPMIGAVANIPISVPFSFYANFDYLFTRFKSEDATETGSEQNLGWFAEAGVKYAITNTLRAGAGYKYETSRGKDSDVRDAFAGATLSVMLVF